jgi:predicted dehydrogenase
VPAVIEVVALVDPDRDHVRAAAGELGIGETHARLSDVLSRPDIDAVSICSPHALHAEMAIASANSGKHVLVEKPMATTVAAATAMIAAAEAADVSLCVAENQVYESWVDHLRGVLRDPASIGNLAFASVISGFRTPSPGYPGRRAWLTRPEAGGSGPWLLQGIHCVAVCRRILGEVASVFVREHRTPTFERPDLEATMTALLTLGDGTPVWLVQTPEVDMGLDQTVYQLWGDAGSAAADRNGCTLTHGATTRGDRSVERIAFPPPRLSSYALELEAFADMVNGRSIALTSGRSERLSLAVIEAGYESLRSGLPVTLRQRYPELEPDLAGAAM